MTTSTAPLATRHALVTGAGRGIGAAIVRVLAAEGAAITLMGRQREPLEKMAAELGARCHVALADVSNAAEVATAFASARAALGPIHILVNNAGRAGSAPLLKTDAALWESMLAVNLTGTFLCTKAALPDMLAAKFGRIVNVASTAGLIGQPYISAYCASKHGVIGLTRALALELAMHPITVNAVCPSFTETDILHDTLSNITTQTGRSEQEARALLLARNPQKRFIQPEEVAHVVRWLCLPGTESITGQSVPLAGGEVT